jgi:proline iminopeptidase
MFISIPGRSDIPETELFLKIIKKNNTQDFLWYRDTIILIHGGPGGNHTLYSDIEQELLKIADLVLIDLRGCGLSSKIETKYCTLDTHIDDLCILLNILKIPNPIIHGCSYGAIVTLGFSIRYPKIPKKIILSSCATSSSFIKSAKENLKKRGTGEQIRAAERLWNGNFENSEQFVAYYKSMASLYFSKEPNNSLPATSQNIPYNVELINLAFTTFLKTFDFCKDLNKIQAQTLIFSGKDDWICDIQQAKVLHHGINHSILVILDKCGHFPWKDQREKFLTFMNDFINHT